MDFLLGFACVALAIFAWRMKRMNLNLRFEVRTLQQKTQLLQTELEQAIQKLAEYETPPRSIGEGLFQRVVESLVALGVPGLVLLVAVATSGFAGAAALTTGLATLGGPLGMVGGIGPWCSFSTTHRNHG
jgi:hypothetical protein